VSSSIGPLLPEARGHSMAACRWCGRFIVWDRAPGRWVPLGKDGTRHVCPPGTRRSMVTAGLAQQPFVAFSVTPGVGRVAPPIQGVRKPKPSAATPERRQMSDAEVLSMLRRIDERPRTSGGQVSSPIDRRFGPISRVTGTNAALRLPGASVDARRETTGDAAPRSHTQPEGVAASLPRTSTPASCFNCGRTGHLDVRVPHFARSDLDLANLAEERGGTWQSAFCFPRNSMLIRLADYVPKDAEHKHHLACGVQTIKTTYRVHASN
jgi:hypothetical protein